MDQIPHKTTISILFHSHVCLFWMMIHFLFYKLVSPKNAAYDVITDQTVCLRHCCVITRPPKEKSVSSHVWKWFHNSRLISIHSSSCNLWVVVVIAPKEETSCRTSSYQRCQFPYHIRHWNARQTAWEMFDNGPTREKGGHTTTSESMS